MRVLICGSRYGYAPGVTDVLDALHAEHDFSVLINGRGAGVDQQAWRWAGERNLPRLAFPARWTSFGRAAGPIRNRQMLNEGRPELVIAFPGGDGTADVVDVATGAGVRVLKIGEG